MLMLLNSPIGCTPASGYLHCRVLAIDHKQVHSTLTNFPMLVSGTLGSSRIQNASCFDVIFTSDSAGTTKIPWEQEQCTKATGVIVYWVQVASVSSVSDTRIYVSYDNAAISTAQNTGSAAPTNVWDANYLAVWHLAKNNINVKLNDSTSNANTLSLHSTVATVPGEIDGGSSHTTPNYLFRSNLAAMDGASQITISFWANPSTSGSNIGYWSQWNGSIGALIETVAAGFGLKGNIGVSFNDGANDVPTSTWTYTAYSYDGTQSTNATKLVEYVNGSPVTLTYGGTIPTTWPTSGGANMQISFVDSAGFGGIFDEWRISTGIARSAAWTAAEYANQAAGSTFLGIGSEM